MKKYHGILILAMMLISIASQAQQAIAQPYYSESKIRFYNKSNPVAGSPCYTLDLSADINTNWGTTSGINDVVIYQGKLFLSIDNGNNEGGVLVYNYADVYPTKTAGPVSVINPQNTHGLPVAGIAIQPSTGNLYVGTFYTGASDAGIYTYTAASGYANSSATQLASYYNDASIDQYIANLVFDASGNLWFTEFDGTNYGTATAYTNHFLICYKAANKNNYFKIINTTTKSYTANHPGGGTTAVYLLSQPEGITFDASGNLWLGNNNDNFGCNTAGDGTLVKINSSWITGTLFSQAYGSTNTVPTASATVEYVAGGKLGGLLMDGNNLYINDQGQNQGSSYTSNGTVWKWNVTTTFNTTNFAASGVHTTYPGNGLMALDNSQFSVASDCYPSAEKNILTFSIPTQVGTTTIDTTHATISLLMPSTANLTSLTPTITVSPGASINPLTGVAENFSAPFTYTVRAADATTKTWTVTVTKQTALSDSKNILTFSIPGQVGSSVIDTVGATVTAVMPTGTNLSALTPSIAISTGASINPLTNTAENFSAPYTYTVTAADATIKLWTVTVTDEPSGISPVGAEDITIYPNPAHSNLFIRSSALAEIEIYSLIGEQMTSTQCNNQILNINTSTWAPGIYILQMKFTDGSHATRKFMKE